jgi:Rap1a immunity proteins
VRLFRVLRIGLMSALLFFAPLPAEVQADTLTGNDLLNQCERLGNPLSFGCRMYLAGVIDMHYGFSVIVSQPLYCYPAGVTYEQLERIVVKYLRDHPKDLHYQAAYLATVALTDAFPCKR